jgi:hypothetical protein
MAEQYGTIIFSKSDDCKCDIKGIQEIFNEYEWDDNLARWNLDESNGLMWLENDREFHLGTILQNPTLEPYKKLLYELKENDGSIRYVKPIDMKKCDYEKIWNIEGQTTKAAEIVNRISPLIKEGEIIIGCSLQCKADYIKYCEMRIGTKNNGSLTEIGLDSIKGRIEKTERVFSGILC